MEIINLTPLQKLQIAWDRIKKPLSGDRKGYKKGFEDGFITACNFTLTISDEVDALEALKPAGSSSRNWMKRYQAMKIKRKIMGELGTCNPEFLRGFDLCMNTFDKVEK